MVLNTCSCMQRAVVQKFQISNLKMNRKIQIVLWISNKRKFWRNRIRKGKGKTFQGLKGGKIFMAFTTSLVLLSTKYLK